MIDYKKDFKEIYGPYKKIRVIDVPTQNFIQISGKGDPNTSSEFKLCIEKLYKFSYFIKMSYKKDYVIDTYEEYKVFPLEGNWTGDLDVNGKVIKDTLEFDLMIALPDFVNIEVYNYYLNLFKVENRDFDISGLMFVTKNSHKAVQALHIGSYDTEIDTFNNMFDFMKVNSLEKKYKPYHKEIYLSDSRRVSSDKLKTLIRFEI